MSPRTRRHRRAWRGGVLLAAAALLAACAPQLLNTQPAAEVAQSRQPPGSVYSGWRVFQARCASCHGAEAKGTAALPRLAGQYAAYTETQLKQFNQRERTNDNAVMLAIVVKMTALEMAAVSEYLSGQ